MSTKTVAISRDVMVGPSRCSFLVRTKKQRMAHRSTTHTIWDLDRGFLMMASGIFNDGLCGLGPSGRPKAL